MKIFMLACILNSVIIFVAFAETVANDSCDVFAYLALVSISFLIAIMVEEYTSYLKDEGRK